MSEKTSTDFRLGSGGKPLLTNSAMRELMKPEQLKRRLLGILITAVHPCTKLGQELGLSEGNGERSRKTLFVRAADAGDVREAVHYAHETGASFSVRARSGQILESERYADMLIDVTALRHFSIDASALQARVEPCVSGDPGQEGGDRAVMMVLNLS